MINLPPTLPKKIVRLPPLVLVGAQSRAGKAILQTWPGDQVIAVHRGEGPGIRVADYSNVPEEAIPPESLIVNCVGSPFGTEQALFKLNRDVALHWAEAGAKAGAFQFIQLSSFSVYGRVEHINRGTTERPFTAYGKSKLAADQSLIALGNENMAVTIVRIPMLFGYGTGKLAQLVQLVRRTGIVPDVEPLVERSMLGYDSLAAIVLALAQRPVCGIVLVADPTVFTYELLREGINRATGQRIRHIRIPKLLVATIRKIAPSVHARILASSRLEASAAYPFDVPPGTDLKQEIERLAGKS